MVKNREQEVLKLLKSNKLLSSKEIHDRLKFDISYATVKRI
jgi:predicted transcriptional regulator